MGFHLCHKFCFDNPLGCELGNLRTSFSQRSSFSFGTLTVIAFIRMNFHYYFSSCFATTEGCYSSDFNFQDLESIDSCFDHFSGYYFGCFGSEEENGSCFEAEYRLYWHLGSGSFGSEGWS